VVDFVLKRWTKTTAFNVRQTLCSVGVWLRRHFGTSSNTPVEL